TVAGELREVAMTPRKKAMKILDSIFIAFTMVLVMAVGGLPVEWLFDLLSVTSLALEGVTLIVLCVALGLVYAIASPDSGPAARLSSEAVPSRDRPFPSRADRPDGRRSARDI